MSRGPDSGEAVLLNHGDAARAVLASSAVPGLYEPVNVAGRRIVDGRVVSPLPVAAARRLGGRAVIAVDVIYPPEQSAVTSPMSVLFQTVRAGETAAEQALPRLRALFADARRSTTASAARQ